MAIRNLLKWLNMVRATLPVAVFALAALHTAIGQSRPPAEGGRTPSLGQPGYWKWSAGLAMGAGRRDSAHYTTAELRVTLMRDIGNPVIGLAAYELEAFGGTRNGNRDAGLRARLALPFARLGIGGDWVAGDRHVSPALTVIRPMRRSGLLNDGSVARLDVRLGRDRQVSVGVAKPIQRRIPPGATRPGRSSARLYAATGQPVRPPDGTETALAEARAAATAIGALVVPYLDHPWADRARSERAVLAQIDAIRGALRDRPPGSTGHRTADTEARRFHLAIERAFAVALGNRSADALPRVAAQGRAVVLDEVLLPYDRLLGQEKRDDSTTGLALTARGVFLRWLHVESGLPDATMDRALGVFATWLGIIEQVRATQRAAWRDSRFVWLPLQLALRPEDHDTQAEIDALVERATGATFSNGNYVSYIINEQFQYQLSRTIRQAEDYHVLWIHDIRGVDDRGDPDEATYRHLLGSYLAALTARVRAYDGTGRMPVYMILLDQWFYEVRKSRPWMDVLEDPTRRPLRVPARYRAWADSVASAQAELRNAIAGSRLLQAQRAQFGDEWLRNLVKVHVNITNAADFSFWSGTLAKGIAVPDNMLRDHRKLVFYDVTERDPYRGAAIFTGAGVGEHYANRSWEDRAMLVQGPAALHLKAAARALLVGQGMRPDRVPWHLQPAPFGADYAERVASAESGARRTSRALGLQNETGFGSKPVNVGKAVLYTLMPAGSVIKVPDSLWNSAFWASALAGSALRGCKVLVIAPSYANAPAPAFGSMEQAYRMLWRLTALSEQLGPELAERDGLLRVGMWTSSLEVTNITGKLVAVINAFDRHEWLRQLFAFPPPAYDGLRDLIRTLGAIDMAPRDTTDFEYEPHPKLHLKVNAFASREAWQVMARPEWADMTWEFIQQRIAQTQARRNAVRSFEEFPDAMLDVGDGTVSRWLASLTPEERERVVFYAIIGSQNQNPRSMVMDGEDALVTAAWPSVIAYLDIISLIGQSRWIERPNELAALLPPYGPIASRLGNWFRLAF